MENRELLSIDILNIEFNCGINKTPTSIMQFILHVDGER
jgi:hypothetical protein